MDFRPTRNLTLIGLALALAGCGAPDRVEITQTRELQPSEQKPPLEATSAQRFDLNQMVRMSMQDTRPVEPSVGLSEGASYTWETPEGWSEGQPRTMRLVNLNFGEGSVGECYVMQAGGALLANVNRWRGQMGLEPLTEPAVQALPTQQLLGGPAVVVDMKGDFKGMGSPEPLKEYRMIGLILANDAGLSTFVKLTGPQAVVAENESKFRAFCDSLKVAE